MKKIFTLVVLTASLLVPRMAMAECDFTRNLLPGQDENRTELAIEADIRVGTEAIIQLPYTGGLQDFASSDPNVVFVQSMNNASGAGLWAIKAGEAVVTYKELGLNPEDKTECSTEHSVSYTVLEGEPVARFNYTEKIIEEFTASLAENPLKEFPVPEVIIKKFVALNDGSMFVDSIIPASEIRVESSDPNVAYYNEDGILTLVGGGVTTFTLRWDGNEDWGSAEASYVLTVEKPLAEIWFEMEAYNAPLACGSFESPIAQTYPEGLRVVYSSADDSIAIVDAETGEVTPMVTGEVRILAYTEGNDEFDGNETAYILYVEEAMGTEPHFAFEYETNEFYAELGQPFESPMLTCPEDLEIIWSSENDSVATVDEFGNVTIVGVGETMIHAVTHGNQCYYQAHAEYKLIVNEPFIGLRVLGVEVTMDNKDDIWGDQVSYDHETRTLMLNNVVLDMRQMPNLNEAVVEDMNESGELLNVALVGRCEFTNTQMGFNHQVGVRFFGDTLILSGEEAQIYADRVIIDGAYVSVTASIGKETAAIRADELSVINNGHLIAVNTSEEGGKAASVFTLELGENIQLMTEGVEFYRDEDNYTGGFYTDSDHSVEAKEIEIGKVAMPLELKVCGIEVTEENAEDILGNGKAVYDIDHRILTLTDLVMDFQNSAFMSDGGSVIEDGTTQDVMGPLLVVINGRCEFTNTYLGFSGELGFNICTEQGGELYLNGQLMQLSADEITIDGVNVTAIASFGENTPAVNATSSLTIMENGRLLAKNTNEGADGKLGGIAIVTQLLDLGENISILTKDVHFDRGLDGGAGFFTDEANSIFAREVEIGPKPAVVADDEVTTIDFTQTNPDGSEEVVISLGANDNFNEATGQLEISTALTDDQVAEALENLIPGSSAFAAALPGSITFDIPAGRGAIDIQCVTLPGYTLNVKIEGQAAISLTQTTFGWAHVEYDVAVPVHVVLYLHASEPSPAPARVRADNAAAALCIQAIKITPANAPQSIENVSTDTFEDGQKFLYGGQLYILRDGRIFNATGVQVK